jgi:hypothetical protein
MLTTPPARNSIPTTIPPLFSAVMPHTAPEVKRDQGGLRVTMCVQPGDVAVSGQRQLTVAGAGIAQLIRKIALCDDVRVTDEVLADQVEVARLPAERTRG